MKERPILFSGPMVRSILDGRKTQTRRVVKLRDLCCPYGEPGDGLWVKETWAPCIGGPCSPDNAVLYRATEPDADRLTWRPSIFMPRWASRIMLEITAVRVERLQDISEEDAIAEGCEREFKPDGSNYGAGLVEARENYAALWNSINGKPHIERDDNGLEIARHDVSWDANPWVWVIAFKKL